MRYVAVVVARTDATARECLAESMLRGTPELTMQDAVHAAQAEVGRAAGNREAAMVLGPVVGARVRGRDRSVRALECAATNQASREQRHALGGPDRHTRPRLTNWRTTTLKVSLQAEGSLESCIDSGFPTSDRGVLAVTARQGHAHRSKDGLRSRRELRSPRAP